MCGWWCMWKPWGCYTYPLSIHPPHSYLIICPPIHHPSVILDPGQQTVAWTSVVAVKRMEWKVLRSQISFEGGAGWRVKCGTGGEERKVRKLLLAQAFWWMAVSFSWDGKQCVWVRGRGLCCLAMINLRCLLQPQVDNRGEGQDINLVIIGVLLEHSIGRNNFFQLRD